MCMTVSVHLCPVGSKSNTWQVPNAGSYSVWWEIPRRLQSKQCHETGRLMRSYFRNKQLASLSIEYSATVEAHVSHTHGLSTARTRYVSCRVTSVAFSREKVFFFHITFSSTLSTSLWPPHFSPRACIWFRNREFWVFHWHISSAAAFLAPHWLCWMNSHLSQQSIYYVGWYKISLASGFFFIYHFPLLVCQKVSHGYCPDLAHGHLS